MLHDKRRTTVIMENGKSSLLPLIAQSLNRPVSLPVEDWAKIFYVSQEPHLHYRKGWIVTQTGKVAP